MLLSSSGLDTGIPTRAQIATKHPTRQRIDSPNDTNVSISDVHGAEVEKPCPRRSALSPAISRV